MNTFPSNIAEVENDDDDLDTSTSGGNSSSDDDYYNPKKTSQRGGGGGGGAAASSTNQQNIKPLPLKSCLKRKDTNNSNTHLPPSTQTSNRVVQLITHSQTEVSTYTGDSATTPANHSSSSFLLSISTTMFVPCVGYLFTCDLESTGRYCYYNNLERRRRVRVYKELTRKVGYSDSPESYCDEEEEESDDDDDDEDDTDPTATTSSTENCENSPSKKATSSKTLVIQPKVSRSENDLLRRVALFLASVSTTSNSSNPSVIGDKNRRVGSSSKENHRSKSNPLTLATNTTRTNSRGGADDSSSYSTETDEEQDRGDDDEGIDDDVMLPTTTTMKSSGSRAALPLQYNTLMTVLKSKSKASMVSGTASINIMQGSSEESKRVMSANKNSADSSSNLSAQVNSKINLLLNEQRRDSFSKNSKSK